MTVLTKKSRADNFDPGALLGMFPNVSQGDATPTTYCRPSFGSPISMIGGLHGIKVPAVRNAVLNASYFVDSLLSQEFLMSTQYYRRSTILTEEQTTKLFCLVSFNFCSPLYIIAEKEQGCVKEAGVKAKRTSLCLRSKVYGQPTSRPQQACDVVAWVN